MKKCPTSKARRKKIRNQESVCTVFDQIFSSQRQQIRKKTQRIQHLLKTSKSNSSSSNSKQKIIYTHLKQEDRKIAINDKFVLPSAKIFPRQNTGGS